MHPLEQLRYVARGWEGAEDLPVGEVAELFADLAELSPATLLHACRRLIEHFPSSGRLWWLSARALSAPGQLEGIWEAAAELDADPTAVQLAKALPANASVSLARPVPGDLVRALRRARGASRQKKSQGQRIFVVNVLAAGPDALLVDARAAGELRGVPSKQVWGAVQRGTVLPGELWQQVLARTTSTEVLGPGAFGVLVGPSGVTAAPELLRSPTCPPVAELLGWKS